tara:strand:+ start:2787 stop:3371 length:585 start_codon:yes stop_codon:yes gene_type:complete
MSKPIILNQALACGCTVIGGRVVNWCELHRDTRGRDMLLEMRDERDALRERVAELESASRRQRARADALAGINLEMRDAVERVRGLPRYSIRTTDEEAGHLVEPDPEGNWLDADDVLDALGREEGQRSPLAEARKAFQQESNRLIELVDAVDEYLDFWWDSSPTSGEQIKAGRILGDKLAAIKSKMVYVPQEKP